MMRDGREMGWRIARRVGNPFIPAFGHVPYAVAGRSEYIDDVIEGLANTPGDPNRSAFFIGPRRSGNTVLLATIARVAEEQGWVCANVTAGPGMLEELLAQIRMSARHLLTPETSSFITSVQVGPVGIGVQHRQPEHTWREKVTTAVADLNAQGAGLLFTIDEVDPACDELIEFVSVYQHLVTEDRDVAMLLAGLSSMAYGLMDNRYVSFVRRAFQRTLWSISTIEVERALLDTFEGDGHAITPEASRIAAEATGGFAFAIQVVGYYLWRQGSPEAAISERDVRAAIPLARREMGNAVIVPTLRELTTREEQYLYAMAPDDGPSSTGDVARRMGISMSNASNLRRRLIDRRVICEVRLGQVDFEVPMMRDCLRERSR